MKLFSSFSRAKQTKTADPHAEIAQRLQTLEGCDAYLSELEKIKVDHAGNAQISIPINAKIEQVSRAAARLRLQSEHKAVTAAIEDSKTAAVGAIKAAEKALAVADGEHTSAVQACAAMEARMVPMSARVAELRQQAAQRVQTAQANFDAVMTQANTDEAAELKASQTLIEAQHGLASSGAAEGLRLDKLAQQLDALKAAEQAAAQAHQEAVAALNQALAMDALVEFDRVSLQVLDAYFLTVEARARPGVEVRGWRFPNAPLVWFTRSVHGLGHRGDKSEGGGELPQWQVQYMADAFRPINLNRLAEPLPVPVQITDPLSAGDSTLGEVDTRDATETQ